MSDEIPQKLQDEYAVAKIFLAIAAIVAVVGIFLGVAFGFIPADNKAAEIALPTFSTLVGVAIGFYFASKQRASAPAPGS
jgi:hypothetical protein